MISVSGLSVHFGGTVLFDDVSYLINVKDRIGLTGKNGAGKSTMLKILAGINTPSAGSVALQNGCSVGYLPQEMVHNLGKTVFDETATAFAEAKSLEKKIEYYNEQLVTRTDYESDEYMKLIEQLNEANDRFHIIGGYQIEAEIEQILLGLGFKRSDFTRLTDEFSGGWRMRIELAKILLQKPNVFLLDEPTNHLDIESIQWLEEFLKTYNGAVVLISHDKAFLDNLTNRTIEISSGRIYDYKANYSKYLELRKERKDQQQAEARNQEKYIEQTEALINKFRAKSSKASFAQSLIKKLDRLERVEVDEDDLSAIRFKFPPAPRSGKVIVEAEDLKKVYPPKTIFSKVNYMIEREEKIAFVGKNGEGKSTMIKLIVGDEPFEGKLTLGHNVTIGYFAQNQAELLDGDKTVFETIDEVAVGDMRKNVRSLLGSFLFSGETVDKKVKVLSGGEKTRLALCKLLLQPYNFLVLDEPTNHLDMRSKDVLKQALLDFDGTLVLVSHDRDFLQGLCGKIYEFRDGNIKEFIGDLNEYLAARKIETLQELNAKTSSPKEVVAPKPTKPEVDVKKGEEKETRIIKNRIQKLEQEIATLESRLHAFDKQLQDPEQFKKVSADTAFFEKYENTKRELESFMKEWEDLSMQV